jgi:hypothetical protein
MKKKRERKNFCVRQSALNLFSVGPWQHGTISSCYQLFTASAGGHSLEAEATQTSPDMGIFHTLSIQ